MHTMKPCGTCANRWMKPGHFEEWYCRPDGKPMRRIGTKWELAAAAGCREWQP